jgi:hypothetical protein
MAFHLSSAEPRSANSAASAAAARAGVSYARAVYLLVALKLLTSVFLSESEEGIQSAYAIFPKIVDSLILIVGVIGLAVAPSTKRKWRVVASSLALLLMAAVSQAIAGRSFMEAGLILAKLLAPLILLSACVLNQNATGTNVGSRAMVWWVLLLVIAGLVFVEPSFRNDREWMPAYFSGTHTSAYVSIFAIAIALAVLEGKWWQTSLSLPVVILAFMVVFGWGVRTAMAGGAIASLYIVFNRASSKQRVLLLVLGMFVGFAFILLAVSFGWITTGSLEEFSSGRTSVWMNRVSQIATRPPVEWLVGTGAGSNVTYSDVWWWELKDSHNDFLAIIYEQGAVGLALALALMASVYKLVQPTVAWNAVWLMYFGCSLLSNGVMFRPTASFVFMLAALAAFRAIRKERA